jgi:hypothetical protein
VWATQINGRWKIARLIVSGAPAPKNAPPRPVTFGGGRPLQFAGTLVGDAMDSYTIPPRRGIVLDVTIERFPRNDLELQVVDVKSGQPVEGFLGPRRWRGAISSTGGFRIDIIRRADYCSPPTSYLLTIATR